MRYRSGLRFYRRTLGKRLAHNKPTELVEYLRPYVKDIHTTIADIGSGPVCCIGNMLDGQPLSITASDVCQRQYTELLGEQKLIVPVEYQDMEHLTYKTNTFDVVHCANALDHTPRADLAIEELKRVCKSGGVVILRHMPMQRKRYAGHHFWNIYVEKGTTMMSNDVITMAIQGRTWNDGLIIMTEIWKT